MTVCRGNKHDYLGVTLNFSKDGAFIVDMQDYLKDILKYLRQDMNGTATALVTDHLFKVRDNAPKLNKERADCFHGVVAQFLFVAHRGQQDHQTTVSFLTKRVQAPDEGNYKKLT